MDIVNTAKQSLKLALHNKSLWLFGFFVAAGSSSGISDSSTAHAATGAASTAIETNPAWLGLAIGAAVIVGLCAFIMHIVSEAALIEGVVRADRVEPYSVKQGLQGGLQSFKAVFTVKLVMLAIALLSVSALAAPFLLYDLKLIPLAAAIPLGLLAVVIGVPWAISLYLVYELALRFVVLDNRNAVDAIGKARLFLHARLSSSLSLLLAVGLGQIAAGFAIALGLIPAALLAGAAYLVAGTPTAIAIGVVFGLPVAMIVVGVLGTYQSSVWTLGYQKLQSTEG